MLGFSTQAASSISTRIPIFSVVTASIVQQQVLLELHLADINQGHSCILGLFSQRQIGGEGKW
jgi:hypothetical protein